MSSDKRQFDVDQWRLDLKTVMSSEQGRRVVWRILAHCGQFRTSMTGEALSTAFNEGRRDVGLYLIRELATHCRGEFVQLQTEGYAFDD